jgi:hypothetical protein
MMQTYRRPRIGFVRVFVTRRSPREAEPEEHQPTTTVPEPDPDNIAIDRA